jgi:hypothetical protein
VVFFLQIEPEPRSVSGRVDQALKSFVGIGGKPWMVVIESPAGFDRKSRSGFLRPGNDLKDVT